MEKITKQEAVPEAELTPEQVEKLITEKVARYSDRLTAEEQKSQVDALKKVFIQGLSPRLAMGISSDLMKIIYAHAYNLYNGGKYEEANGFFKMLIQLEPAIPRYHMGLAASFQKLKKYETAVQCYFALAVIDQTTPIPFYHIASCYEELNQPLGVVMALGGAISRSGENPQYAKIKARCLAMLSGWKSKLGVPEKKTESPPPSDPKEKGPDIFGQLQDSVRKKNL